MTDLIETRNISKIYGATHALTDVSFSASAGEVHALVGENGAGKSTLMKILSGAVIRDGGEILIGGHATALDSPLQAHRRGIRTVYQELSLDPYLSVTENLLLGRLPTGKLQGWVDWKEAHRQAGEILAEIGFPEIDVRQKVMQLSVSFQQIVEIAKAWSAHPDILILDEPSAVLTQAELAKLFSLIRRMRADGHLVLYISHRLDEVFEIADRITVLKDGQMMGTVRPAEITQGDLIKMMVGRTLSEIYPVRKYPGGEDLLKVKNLTRPGHFKDVSFALRKGEILGMFGLIGSGRTQVGRCIFGADEFSAGSITFEGRAIHPRSPREALDLGIAMLTEERKRDGLVSICSVLDNMGLASYASFSKLGWVNRQGLKIAVSDKSEELDIRPRDPRKLISALSGGNQQKVILGKWLLTRAKVLILDEPTRGVDVATKAEFYQIFGKLAARGISILLISSEMPEILGMSDRILVMREGRVAAEFSRTEATEEKLLSHAAGVTA